MHAWRVLVVLAVAECGAAAAPSIAKGGIYNNASYARDGALNRGIAEGSVFAVFGSGLGPAALQQVASFPLPKELGGVSVKVTPQSGAAVDAYPLYVTEGQIGVLLPSSVPIGNAAVTVTYQGQASAPEPITVVRRSFGIFTANQAGSGPAIVQNFVSETDQPLNTLTSPARPGQTVILWGTGLGPIAGNDADGPAPGDIVARMTVYVGGVRALARYTGRSGCCAGIDQVVFDVPSDVQGCYVPVQVVGAGLLSTRENATIPIEHTVSNSVTISVASGGPCTDASGLTGPELAALAGKSNARIAAFDFVRRPAGILEYTQETASGRVARYDAVSLLRSRGVFGIPSAGSCLQYQVGHDELTGRDPIPGAPLDAGASLTVAGPGGSRQIPRAADGGYSASLGGARESGGSSPLFLSPGAHTLTGTGGADVGAFEARFTVPPAPSWTNRDPAALEHSFRPFLSWTAPADANYMLLAAYGRNDITAFYTICAEDPAKGQFTIPDYAYAGLVQHTSSAPGVVWIAAGAVTRFSAPGLDYGFINAVIGTNGVFVP